MHSPYSSEGGGAYGITGQVLQKNAIYGKNEALWKEVAAIMGEEEARNTRTGLATLSSVDGGLLKMSRIVKGGT